jgi:CheY-like chemotaxis protein
MRYLIVDDRPEMRDAREMWLRESADTRADLPVRSCTAVDFEDARSLEEHWRDYDCLVVDAHDDRCAAVRAHRAKEAGVQYRDYDRFPGRDVVLTARKHHPGMLIIAVSYYARHEPEVAAQFAGAGADYLFGTDQVPDRETFVAAVRNPRRHEEAVRYARSTSARTAQICDLVAAATDEQLDMIFDRAASKKRAPRPVQRMMQQLKDLLDVVDQGGPKAPYAQHMRSKLRKFHLRHLPNMDNPDGERY